MNLTSAKGTYALLLDLPTRTKIAVGKLGLFEFPAGCYVYIGSAFGPGGLAARVGRHARKKRVLRWHVDFLTTQAQITGVLATARLDRLECAWVRRLLAAGGQVVVPGFGASDCGEGCPSHLIHFAAPVTQEELQIILQISGMQLLE